MTLTKCGFLPVAGVCLVVVLIICEVNGVMTKLPGSAPPKKNSSKIIFTSPSSTSTQQPSAAKSKKDRGPVVLQPLCKLDLKSCPEFKETVKEEEVEEPRVEEQQFAQNGLLDPEIDGGDSLVDESEFVYDDSSQDTTIPDSFETTMSNNNNNQADGIGEEDLKAKPRLIAVKVPAVLPPPQLRNETRPFQSLYAKYPTVRLADFARKIIFPEWIWTRFTPPPIIKKSEVAEGLNPDVAASRPADETTEPGAPSTTTRRPKGILERPTITFDNNMSRFLRLFTVVRFQNLPCTGPNGENGTCYNGKECADLGGQGTTSCAQGLGVCCLFFKSCGETVTRNGTYFVSKGAPFQRGVSTCNINIQKISPSVRQIRLNLHTFVMHPPNAGNCETDRFLVSGQNTNNIIPILCGNNSGSHIYIETGTSQSQIQLSVMTTNEGHREWMIQINQIDDANAQHSAPPQCLQYHEGTMGTITSFNYESSLSPQYLNNLNYAICIRKEAGFCSVTYSNLVPDGQYYPFQIVNADAQGNLLMPSGQAGVGIRNCPEDYIILNGIRLCGERLNDGTKSTLMMDDHPVTDATNGPFMINIRTNEIDVGGGFSIYFRQNPCMSTAG